MTYRYAIEAEDDLPPCAAICDDCGAEIHEDEWRDCEVAHVRMDTEHSCSDCRAEGNREHARDMADWNAQRYDNMKGEM